MPLAGRRSKDMVDYIDWYQSKKRDQRHSRRWRVSSSDDSDGGTFLVFFNENFFFWSSKKKKLTISDPWILIFRWRRWGERWGGREIEIRTIWVVPSLSGNERGIQIRFSPQFKGNNTCFFWVELRFSFFSTFTFCTHFA